MGFEETLPTHKEIYALEAAKKECETEEEKIEIEKQIELKKLSLAELPGQFDLGLPRRLAADIERKAAIETEMVKKSAESKTR